MKISLQKIAEVSNNSVVTNEVLTVLIEKLTETELLNFNQWLDIVKDRQNDIKSDYKETFDEQLTTIEGLANERDLYSEQAKEYSEQAKESNEKLNLQKSLYDIQIQTTVDLREEYSKLECDYKYWQRRYSDLQTELITTAIEFGDWLKTFESLTREHGQWIIESQITTKELLDGFQKEKSIKRNETLKYDNLI